MRKRFWLAALCLVALPTAAQEAAEMGEEARSLLEAIVEQAAFPDDAGERIRRGEIVSSTIQEEGSREIAAFVALILDAPVDRVFELARSGGALELDATILDRGDLPAGEVDASAFAGLTLPDAELDRLLADGRQGDFNLSNQENARLQTVARETKDEPAARRRQAIDTAYRELLAARVNAYRKQGIAGIAPYERADGASFSAAEDLRSFVDRLEVMPKYAPDFTRALQAPPAASTAAIEQYLQWRLIDVQGRPTVVLVHGLRELDADHGIGAARHFYVGASYESLQVMNGIFSFEGKSLVFHVNVTRTHQVSGFGSSAKRGIGRRLMAGEVKQLFESIRQGLSQG